LREIVPVSTEGKWRKRLHWPTQRRELRPYSSRAYRSDAKLDA